MFTGFCGVDILRLAVKSTLKVTNSLHTLPPPALTSHSPTSYSHLYSPTFYSHLSLSHLLSPLTLPPPTLTSHSPTSYSHIPLSRLLLLPLTSHPPNSYSHFQRSQC